MIRPALAMGFVLAAAAQGLAQQATVYSGEHADFTRIAIVFGADRQWEVAQEDKGYRISFTPPAPSLDLSGIYDRIPRDRFERVEQSPEDASLVIESSCACTLEVFVAGDRTIAIDVRDDPTGPENLTGLGPASGDSAIPRPRRRETAMGTEQQVSVNDAAPVVRPPAEEPSLILPVTNPRQDRISEGGLDLVVPEVASTAPSVAETAWRQALIEGLIAAGDAGLVEFSPASDVLPGSVNRDPTDLQVETEVPRASDRDNLDIRTAYETFLQLERAARAGDSRRACLPDSYFSFFETAELTRGLPSIQAHRAGLVTPLGDVSPQGALTLTQAYLALGFGREALAILDMAGLAPDEAAVLSSLATIVDFRSDNAREVWSGLQRCEGVAALWAILGQPIADLGRTASSGSAQQAFFALPPHLRVHLGEELATRFDRLGDPDAASAVRLNVELLTTPLPNGNAAEPSGNDQPLPLAEMGPGEARVWELLTRLQEDMLSGRPINMADLETAESLTWEYEGTESGLRLRGASVLGRLEQGELEAAISLLEEGALDGSEDPLWNASLRAGIGTAITSTTDAQLLTIVLHPDAESLTSLLSPPQKLDAARRLLLLGFPQEAIDVVSDEEPSGMEQIKTISASAYIAQGDPALALATIAGRTSDDVSRLRAQAHYALGNFALAAAASAEAGDTDFASHAAWLSGQSEAILSWGTDEQRSIAANLRETAANDGDRTDFATPPNSVPEPTSLPSLETSRSLIDRSETTRAALMSLLADASDAP